MTHLSRLVALLCVVLTFAGASFLAARASTPAPAEPRIYPTLATAADQHGWNNPAEFDAVAVGNLLDRFHAAAAKADLDAYFACMTENAVFLGTDATERWVGEEFRKFCEPHFKSGTGWTYKPRGRNITVASNGGVAWFDELLDNDKLGLCRGSGVAVREDEEWRVAQYNLSIPIPNEVAGEVVQFIQAAKAQNDAP